MTIDDGLAMTDADASGHAVLNDTAGIDEARGLRLTAESARPGTEEGETTSALLAEERTLRPLLVLGDAVALFIGSAFGHLLSGYVHESSVAQRAVLMVVTAVGGLWAMRREGLWSDDDASQRLVEPRKLARAVTTLGLILLVADRFVRLGLGLLEAVVSCLTVFSLLALWRSAFRGWLAGARAEGRYLRPTVVVGASEEVGRLMDALLAHPELGLDVRGFVGQQGDGTTYADLRLGDLGQAEDLIRTAGATRVIVSPVSLNGDRLNTLAGNLQRDGIHVFVTTGLTGVEPQRLRSVALAQEPVLHLDPASSDAWHRLLKRAFDFVASAVLLVVMSPVLFLVALAVGLTSRGGIIFRHERVGKDGELFRIYKFRTMVPGTHERIWSDEAAASEFRASGFKLDANDPSITPVGRFLRKTSLDELPQLVNVLRGDMSMVGVRPLVPVELAERSEFDQALYCAMKPGITGLWQVNGRSTVVHEDRHALDRQYMESWSLSLDLSILLRTPFAVLRHHHSA